MKLDVNLLQKEIHEGKISTKEGLRKLSVFILSNPAIFGLEKDEDLLSDVVTRFLEKDDWLFLHFNPDYGSFFTYFFCYVKSIIVNCNRKKAVNYARDIHYYNESVINYEHTLNSYNQIDFNKVNTGHVPYKPVSIPPEAFKLACKSDDYKFIPYKEQQKKEISKLNLADKFKTMRSPKIERLILVLALKSSYYLTEEQIEKISVICNIDISLLKDAVFILNKDLYEKVNRHQEMISRRNNAWYLKKKYENQITQIKDTTTSVTEYTKLKLEKKQLNQEKHWEMLNELLKNGFIYIRPTNKAISSIIGLCERQISYYLHRAKELKIEF